MGCHVNQWMLLSEAVTHRGNQWGQITISLIRRQHSVWPGRCRWRACRVLVERKKYAEKVGGCWAFAFGAVWGWGFIIARQQVRKHPCWGLLEGKKASARICAFLHLLGLPLATKYLQMLEYFSFLPFQSTLCDVEDGARQAASWLHWDLFSHESSLRTQGIHINQVIMLNMK